MSGKKGTISLSKKKTENIFLGNIKWKWLHIQTNISCFIFKRQEKPEKYFEILAKTEKF